jgi:hypothetical protein
MMSARLNMGLWSTAESASRLMAMPKSLGGGEYKCYSSVSGPIFRKQILKFVNGPCPIPKDVQLNSKKLFYEIPYGFLKVTIAETDDDRIDIFSWAFPNFGLELDPNAPTGKSLMDELMKLKEYFVDIDEFIEALQKYFLTWEDLPKIRHVNYYNGVQFESKKLSQINFKHPDPTTPK